MAVTTAAAFGAADIEHTASAVGDDDVARSAPAARGVASAKTAASIAAASTAGAYTAAVTVAAAYTVAANPLRTAYTLRLLLLLLPAERGRNLLLLLPHAVLALTSAGDAGNAPRGMYLLPRARFRLSNQRLPQMWRARCKQRS